VKLLRYRRPSLRNLSGYTQVKRQAKRQLGVSQVQAGTVSSEAAHQITHGLLLPDDARGSQHREEQVPVFPRTLQEQVAQSAHRSRLTVPMSQADDEQDPQTSFTG
jgi:hypothetical protein